MLQSDFDYMISPRMSERYVLRDLEACCRALDHPCYHVDGKGQLPHLDLLLALEDPPAIQWIPGDGQPPPEDWLPLLARIRDAGKLCQINTSFAGMRTILRALGGRGFAFWIKKDSRLYPEEAKKWLRSCSPSERLLPGSIERRCRSSPSLWAG